MERKGTWVVVRKWCIRKLGRVVAKRIANLADLKEIDRFIKILAILC